MNLLDLLDSPQVGEYAFNQMTADAGIADTSERHLVRMLELVGAKTPAADGPRRLLEIGAYRHYSGHLLADRGAAEVFLTDISGQALESGRALATAAGVRRHAELCTADFHALPFADGYFDVVYVASSIHHSRQPEVVLREMLRVLRAGGAMWIDNEPVGREFCTYTFRGNRPESFTGFERALHEAGLLTTVSSPFIGSRPEELFGMVENDRIPLDLYLAELTTGASIESLSLDHQQTSSEFDRRLLHTSGPSEEAIAPAVFHECVERVRTLPHGPGPIDRALGFELPAESAWRTVARRMAAAIVELRRLRDGAEIDRVKSRLFGAALQACVRKAGASAKRVASPFSRPMVRSGNCWVAAPSHAHPLFALVPMLPDVHDATQRDRVESVFDARQFAVVEESFGANSLSNRAPAIGFDAALTSESALLVVRVYAIAQKEPYALVVRQGERTLGEALIAQSESHLFKGIVNRGAGTITLESRDLGGRPLAIAGNLRIGVFQLLAPESSRVSDTVAA